MDRMKSLTIGTRSSPLAMWQTRWVKRLLTDRGWTVHIREIKTSGDKIQTGPLAEHGGKGLFVKELEAALLAGEIDLAVHSLKDVPTTLSEDFHLPAFLPRADARDCLICLKARDMTRLPEGSRVGSSSPRRISQLLKINPKVVVENLRGNVGTRLSKIEAGDLTATFLAKAGLDRLEQVNPDLIHAIPLEVMVPAAGQGIVAIETAAQADEVVKALTPLDDPSSRAAALAERTLVRELGGSCTSPIGGHARIEGDLVLLDAFVGDLKGEVTLRESLSGPRSNAENLAKTLAERLHSLGAGDILRSCEETRT